ncbi:MAG: MBL fold metallo-hydrolase [Clostridia bacterium]|nr:MBL fold metallo-hydrolase [Clostridia bacterium]
MTTCDASRKVKNVEIWYLYHSGFAVGIEDTLFIFDYFDDSCPGAVRSLSAGVVNPEELKAKKVKVFSSHKHPDHFNPIILSWKKAIPDIEYFLSSDIPKRFHQEGFHIMKPYALYESEDFTVRTFKSTDKGVAFLVTYKGVTLYHAGDLHWWYWEEMTKAEKNNMTASFKRELDFIKSYAIDIAFVPADPRLEAHTLLGLKAFLEAVSVKTVFPMHFGGSWGIMDLITHEMAQVPALSKVKLIQKRGQHFNILL